MHSCYNIAAVRAAAADPAAAYPASAALRAGAADPPYAATADPTSAAMRAAAADPAGSVATAAVP